MNTYRPGFNAIAADGRIGDEQRFIDTCVRMKSRFQMVISDPNLATRLYDACGGQTDVIYRSYGEGDNRFWDWKHPAYRDPIQYGIELMGLSDKRLVLHASNEPNPDPYNEDEVKQCLDWHAIVIETVCSHGRKLVVGNFAAGGGGGIYLHLLFNSTVWDNFLHTVNKYYGLCWIGIHEYAPIFIPHTWDSILVSDRDTKNFQPGDWLRLNHEDKDFRFPDYRVDLLPWTYHLYRYHWIAEKARDLGLNKVHFIVTESGTDRLQDVDGENGIYEYWKNKLGVPTPYSAPHGYYANYKVYRTAWPEWSISEAIFEQISLLDDNYAEDVEGILTFMWGYDEEFSSRGFNLAPDRVLHELMIERSAEVHSEPPITHPDPEEDKPMDMLDYLMGDGHTYTTWTNFPGHYVGVSHNQTDLDGRRFYHTKGVIVPWNQPATAEELWYDDHYVWRGLDASPGNSEVYTIYGDPELTEYGQPWIPRNIGVGEKFYIESWVVFQKLATGEIVPGKEPYLFPHWIELHVVYDTYTFEGGLTIPDVIELWGYLDDGRVFEKYFYAKGFGLVGWVNPFNTDWRMYLHSTTAPGRLTREIVSWHNYVPSEQLPSSSIPYIPEEKLEVSIESTDPRWKKAILEPQVSGNIRIRTGPGTSYDIVGTFNNIQNVFVIPEEESEPDAAGNIWYPYLLDSEQKALHEDIDKFDAMGWIRNDVGDYVLVPDEPDDIPDPDPTDPVYARIYIPMGEHITNPMIANAIADRIQHSADEITYYADLTDENTQARDGLQWLAMIYRNWQDTMAQANGIIIYEIDEDGNLVE